jgi:hypothetical protein
VSEVLSVQEQIDLSHLEERIAISLRACREAAIAMKEIHDRKLYRASAQTFEQYCLARWRLTDTHVRNLIEFAEISTLIENTTKVALLPMPENERQVRPLKTLPPEQQLEAWETAIELTRGKPTSSEVGRAVAALKVPKSELFEARQETTVIDEASSHYSQVVRVRSVKGVIVYCESLEGIEIDLPFLAHELASDLSAPVDSQWRGTPKIDRTDALEVTLQVERDRVKLLESMLSRFVRAVRMGQAIDPRTLAEAERLLG